MVEVQLGSLQKIGKIYLLLGCLITYGSSQACTIKMAGYV